MSSSTLALPSTAETSDTYRRITWRLMPLLFTCYIFAHLDRINIGFAKLQMTQDLGFSDSVYGFGAGLFFIAYALFGVPSNLALDRVGPRRWIATLMVVWGLLSSAMLLVDSAAGFYLLRFLLGVAEAGFPRHPGAAQSLVPGQPQGPGDRAVRHRRAHGRGDRRAAVGLILESFHDLGGMRGWQWMFLIEGLPVVLLGLVVLKALPESIDSVGWLSDQQKQQLHAALSQEEQHKPITRFAGILQDRHIWLLVCIYFAVMLAVNTIAFWMPTLIHHAGIARDSRVGLLSALPYLAGCLFMIGVGRSSDRLRERRWHLSVPLLMSSVGLIVAGLAPDNAWLVMAGLLVAGMGASAALPMFWQLPPAFLASNTQAAGIALISSFGSIAAFLAPYLIGVVRDATQSASLALYALALLIAGGALAGAAGAGPYRQSPGEVTMLSPSDIQQAAARLDAAERNREQIPSCRWSFPR